MSVRSMMLELVEALKATKVLCIGDVMLDRFIYGNVDRISPEAPIPVLLIKRENAMMGGAGNVVRNLDSLGVRSCFMSVVGDDLIGSEVSKLMRSYENVEPFLVVEKGRNTTTKTRFIADGQQLLRTDSETSDDLSEESQDIILTEARKLFYGHSIIALSDYGKGVLSKELIHDLIESAKLANCQIIVDPKKKDFNAYRGATIITPNRKELHEATSMPVDSDEQIIEASRWVIANCGISCVLATRSQDGMSLVLANDVWHFQAKSREVFDVSGAGDTVLATLAAALAAGASLQDAAEFSNIAAGIVVGKAGTAVVYDYDLVNALRKRDVALGECKLVSKAGAMDQMEFWRLQGCRVGFTNGCFDLLHPGHIALLTAARSHCDKLVVALNSDKSVKKLKGDSRPIQPEEARAEILSAIAVVDLIVIFNEETPLKLIQSLNPDILVKGADYSVEQVVGADHVIGRGGKIVLVDLKAGFSTTSTIERMKD